MANRRLCAVAAEVRAVSDADLSHEQLCAQCNYVIEETAKVVARHIIGKTTLLQTPPEELEAFVLQPVAEMRALLDAGGASPEDTAKAIGYYHSCIASECARIARTMVWEGGTA